MLDSRVAERRNFLYIVLWPNQQNHCVAHKYVAEFTGFRDMLCAPLNQLRVVQLLDFMRENPEVFDPRNYTSAAMIIHATEIQNTFRSHKVNGFV